MKIPKIEGVIERRLLINFSADPEIIRQIIPLPFRPKLYQDKSIVGICLIRLKQIRPSGLPGFLGISSENAAHRIAVEWTEDGEIKEGAEEEGHYSVACSSADGTKIAINARKADEFDSNSIFQTIGNASKFFENGSVGYSPNLNKFEGLQLKTLDWKVEPLDVMSVQSSFFENEKLFPKGSAIFDHALLMTEVKHEWLSVRSKRTMA